MSIIKNKLLVFVIELQSRVVNILLLFREIEKSVVVKAYTN